MAEPTPNNAFAFNSRFVLALRDYHTTLVARQDDTTRRRLDVLRNVSNCEPHATISTFGIATDLAILEDTYRWYVLTVSVLLCR